MVRRGVRTAILAVLVDQPMHGYQVMQELESRSGGRWRPSAGSVYPTLQLLEDEGLVRSEELEGRRVYTITDAGRAAVEESPLTRHPWFDADGGRKATDIRKLALGLVGAAIQVSRAGSPETQAQARKILVEARRDLYRLLADEEGDGAPEAATDTDPDGGAA
jgi:DNA-binding PadR family transcriptional regulator